LFFNIDIGRKNSIFLICVKMQGQKILKNAKKQGQKTGSFAKKQGQKNMTKKIYFRLKK